jgi:hypothetical protein
LDSGVEIWKVTPSKSDTVWSMLTGEALEEAPLEGSDAETSLEAHPENRSVRTD